MNLKITTLSLLAAVSAQGAVTVFSTDFTTTPAELTIGPGLGTTPILTVDPEPAAAHTFLDVTTVGVSGTWLANTTSGAASTSTITVSLSGLAPHTTLSIDMFLGALGGLDGISINGGDNIVDISLDGTSVFNEGFRSRVEGSRAGYDQSPAGAAASLTGGVPTGGTDGSDFLTGFNSSGWGHDSLYDLGTDARLNDIAHTASTATIVITADITEGAQDEGFAFANLEISTNAPEPSTSMLALLSGVALLGIRRRS